MSENIGNVGKDTKYLNLIKKATSQVLHPNHPRHHGIKMQAHHLISAEGVKESGLGKKLVEFGYDINELDNLVFIPWTLQGACHLGVQLHRGNHTAPIEFDENDDDTEHPMSYHFLVARLVRRLESYLIHECPADHPHGREAVKKKMDSIGLQILGRIQNVPQLAPLTSIATSFMPNSSCGCSGADSVKTHNHNDCPVGRNHEERQGSGQKGEKITFKKMVTYKFKVGY